MSKVRFNASAWVIAAALLWQGDILHAQSDTALQSGGIDEIVVTANKRQESLQDVALAISAIGGEVLESRGIDDMTNMQSYVPGLHVQQQQDNVSISLRGIGAQGTSSITDSGVAFHVDNFYMPRLSGGSALLYDVRRVEVLRGPQGTLYGRNATGGVVNVVSNEPIFTNEVRIGGTYGSREIWEVRGVANLKLSDQLAARASVIRSEEHGYMKNSFDPGADDDAFGSAGDVTARVQLLYKDQNDLKILLSGTYSKLNGTGIPYKYLERNPGGPPPIRALVSTITSESTDRLSFSNDAESYNDTETKMGFLRIEKSLGGVDLFLQGGLLSQNTATQQDLDGSAVDISIFRKTQDNDARSLEFRILSNNDGPLEWTGGLYYFSEETKLFRNASAKGRTPGGVINLPDFTLREFGLSSTIAGFGSATYRIANALRVTGGLRYTKDRKSGDLTYVSNLGQPFPPNLVDVKVSFERLTWKAGLEWDAGDRTLVYINASSGYKAGGFNLTSNGAPYDPETIVAYKIGLKSSPFGGSARVNIDGFYYSYDNLQLSNLTTINGAPGQLTTNAAKATIYGIEIDTQFKLYDALIANIGYSLIDAKFDNYFNTDPRDPNPIFNPNDPAGLGRADLSGNTLPYVSRHTINIGLQYAFDLGPGRVSASASSSWHSKKFLREFNHPVIDYVGPNTRTDISVSYALPDSGLTITGFATNLENDVEKTSISVSPGFLGASATTTYSKPRTIGVKIDYQF